MWTNKNEIISYEQKKIDTIFWIFGVWDDYINDDLIQDLINEINKIYKDGFIDWQNHKW